MSGLDQNTLMRQDYLHCGVQVASTDAKVAASQALLAQRQLLAQQLNLTPMSGLPVSDAAAQITAAIAEHPVVIIAGETGSGKTTQLPKFCLQNGLGLTVRSPIPSPVELPREPWPSASPTRSGRSLAKRLATGTIFGSE